MSTELGGDTSGLEIRLAVDLWKLIRAFDRAIADLPLEKAAQRSAQLRYSKDRLDSLLNEVGLRLVTFDGQAFSAHLPVTPINGDEVDADRAIIQSTIEPSLVRTNQVVHVGKVLLAEAVDVSRD